MIKVMHFKPVATHGDCRIFSEEIHGKDFKKVANEYAETNKANVSEIIDTESKAEKITPEESKDLSEVIIKPKVRRAKK